jgi:hypothetical protein
MLPCLLVEQQKRDGTDFSAAPGILTNIMKTRNSEANASLFVAEQLYAEKYEEKERETKK